MTLSQGTTATGNVNANLQMRGSASKPALSGTVAGSNIQLSGKEMAQPIKIPSVNLSLTPSEIHSSPFNVTSAGTTLNTQFALRDYLAPVPVVDAQVRAPNAQLAAILSMTKAYGITSLDKVKGEGTMNLDLHAVGALKSLSSAEIMRALNGKIDVQFNNVRYSGANIGRELASIARFLNANAASQSAADVTDISTITGNILVKNGIAHTDNPQGQA